MRMGRLLSRSPPPSQEGLVTCIDEKPSMGRQPSDLRFEGTGFPRFLGDAARAEKYGGDGSITGAIAAPIDGAERVRQALASLACERWVGGALNQPAS